ncbi:MAG: hypothetical protein WC967_02080 [Balneolaceae bacterium]
MKPFKIEITSIEQGPNELQLQLPIKAEVVKQLPGKDRADYMFARLESPIFWVDDAKGINTEISGHIKFTGTKRIASLI